MLLFAAGLVAVQRLRLLPAVYVLHLGLAFEILVAWCISYAETFLRIGADEVVRGGSMVAVWIAFVMMLVRHTPASTLIVATIAASTWPAAYYFNVWQHGYEVAPWNRLTLWMFPPTWLRFGLLLTKRIFRIEMQAQKAEELGSYQLAYMIGEGGMGQCGVRGTACWRATRRSRSSVRMGTGEVRRDRLKYCGSVSNAKPKRRRGWSARTRFTFSTSA